MSFPPPPGLNTSQPPASLPARPPPSTFNPAPAFKPAASSAPKPAFTAFAPRAIANTYRSNNSPQYSAPPVTNYNSGAQYQQPTTLPQYDASYSSAPQIRNPFVPTADPTSSTTLNPGFDPEYEAQVQQWQSAYMSRDSSNATTIRPVAGSHNPPPVSATAVSQKEPTTQSKDDAPKTVHRAGGGASWTDSTLLEWDPAHFRIFVGNLAGEVTDDSLLKAFSQYPSVQKARVIRDKRTTKSKGYGFVSFADGDDYFRAARDMAGKYIGSHPVTIKKANTDVRPTTVKNNHKGKGAGGHGKVHHDGVQKKQPKTKGGLKVLG